MFNQNAEVKTNGTIGVINFTENELAAIQAAAAVAQNAVERSRRLTMKQFAALYFIGVSVSMTGKMLDVYGISTSVLYNPYCKARRHCKGMICEKCYAAAAVEARETVRDCYGMNTAILTNVIIPDSDIPYLVSPSGYFRLEAHGDIINEIQVVNYFKFAKFNPHLRFALWTKNAWIVKKAIDVYGLEKPENLVIVGSSYYVDKAMTFDAYDFLDKVFTVYSLAYYDENKIEINCGARSCAECGRCYENAGGREVSEMVKADMQKLERRNKKAAKAAAAKA